MKNYENMTPAEKKQYLEVYGAPPRSKNRTLILPDGGELDYSTDWSEAQLVNTYNARTKGHDVVKMARGAPASLRLKLSGATTEQIDATMQKEAPWSQSIVLRGSKDPTTLYFNEDDNTVYTLDRKEFGLKDIPGDIADLGRPAAGIATEVAATAAMAGSKMPLLGRAASIGTAGALGEKGYEQIAQMFGLEDPRSIGDESVDFLQDAALGSAFEFGGGLGSEALRAFGKRGIRGGAPREETQRGLENYRRAVGEEPGTMSIITGPGSRTEGMEDTIIQYYPEWGGRRLQAGLDQTDAAIERRREEILSLSSGGNAAEPVGSAYEAGTRARQGVTGERVPGGRLNQKQGGWYETGRASVGEQKKVRDHHFPPDTPLPQLSPGVKVPGRKPGTDSQILDPYGNPVASRDFNYGDGVETAGREELPLYQTYSEILEKPGRSSEAMAAVGDVLNDPAATLDDLDELQRLIGPKGIGVQGIPADDGVKLYAAIKNTKRQMAGKNTEAANAMEMYDRTAERFYNEVQNRVNKIFRVAGVDADPEVAFGRIYSAMTGLGNADKLNSVFNKLEPDDADFLRRALLHRFFSSPASQKTAFRKWDTMSKEAKDIVAPPGSYWRTSLDDLVETTDAMKLLDRGTASASALSKEERSFFNEVKKNTKEAARGQNSSWNVASGALTAGLIWDYVKSGNLDPKMTAAAGGVMAVALMRTMKDRLKASGKARILTSPVFYDWATSVTRAIPQGNAPEQFADFMTLAAPRMTDAIASSSLQNMEDLKVLQEAYAASMGDIAGTQTQERTEDGILGPDARPPEQESGGIFSNLFGGAIRR